MAKVIKLTDNSAVTLLPITDSAYVQHRWKEGATGGTTVTSVQDALNNVIDRVDGVHASGSDNQHLSASASENVATISLNGNGGSVKISNNGASSAGSKNAHVAITYSQTAGIQLKVSYTDTNTDHYDIIKRSYTDGLKIFSVGTGGEATGSNIGDYYVPIATTSRLGVVKSVTTGTTSGRDYAVEVKADGTMKVNVPWTDTVPDYSNTYAPKSHVDVKASATAYGHVKVDSALNAASENPVQNKAINTALDGKANSTHTHNITWSGTNYAPADSVSTVNVLTYFNSSSTSLKNDGTASYTTVTVPTTHYVNTKVADMAKALKYQGTISAGATAFPTGAQKGDVYVFAGASTINKVNYEKGDMAIYDGTEWTVVNANWTASDGSSSVTVGGSKITLASIGGVNIDIQVAQEANVAHMSDFSSYVNGLNNAAGTGVVTGAKLETNGGGKKLTLSYTDISSNYNGDSLKTVTAVSQNTQGKITGVTFADIATMGAATASAAGTKGFVPAPPAGSQNKVLTGSATFKTISASQGNHATGLLYKTMDTTEEFTLFDDSAFTGAAVSLATIASPAITVSLS